MTSLRDCQTRAEATAERSPIRRHVATLRALACSDERHGVALGRVSPEARCWLCRAYAELPPRRTGTARQPFQPNLAARRQSPLPPRRLHGNARPEHNRQLRARLGPGSRGRLHRARPGRGVQSGRGGRRCRARRRGKQPAGRALSARARSALGGRCRGAPGRGVSRQSLCLWRWMIGVWIWTKR
jgi:hypothetical protein